MARVLILREAGAAERTAAEIAARGHEPLILPLESFEILAAPPPAGSFAAFAVTSAQAVAPLARHFPGDPRPLFAVGKATASAASDAGFFDVRAADGAAEGIAALAAAGLPAGATILYAAGRTRTGTLETGLAAAGIGCAVWEVYATRRLDPDPAAVGEATGGRAPDAVLVLSVGQAEAFGALCRAMPDAFMPSPLVLALSQRIAAALPVELRRKARISPDRSLASLFERLG
ncbi:MAG TPA: uroporphyrinogen-III synthase [Aurantimonas sp.]|nr:uroporphyrinogen-III synthase [Aurantimonas sp.]